MHPTPLLAHFDAADALWERYGPAEPDGAVIQVAGAFDHVDIEYAAIRRSCALLDQPTRGTLELTGADRVSFLNRMVTQELKNWPEHRARHAFWLNRKGRVDADLRLINLPGRVLVDVDALVAAACAKSLEAFVIADDVTVRDVTVAWHRLALHGPGAAATLARHAQALAGPAPADLQPGEACEVQVAGRHVVVDRCDSAGEIGLELWVQQHQPGDIKAVFEALLADAHAPTPGHTGVNARTLLRPIGWHAYNIARLEAGTPLFMLDFGPHSLPAETGALASRVSFTKGCYLGQEVVARMHALGKPKQVVVALRVGEAPREAGGDAPPAAPVLGAGMGVYLPGAAEPVGAVSSATTSPMLGGQAIALATVKTAHSAPGTALEVGLPDNPAPSARQRASVQAQLAFWQRPA
jgi:folate-binding protein YgfZ